MDNLIQIEEIRKYKQYLQKTAGKEIDEETAARLWVIKYARTWRLKRNSTGIVYSNKMLMP